MQRKDRLVLEIDMGNLKTSLKIKDLQLELQRKLNLNNFNLIDENFNLF